MRTLNVSEDNGHTVGTSRLCRCLDYVELPGNNVEKFMLIGLTDG